MNSTGDYPLGAANDPRAPYNEVENPEIEVELCVGYTIGKKIKVKTSDYQLDEWEDEDGNHYSKPIFENTDFGTLINEQCPYPVPEGFYELDADFTIE